MARARARESTASLVQPCVGSCALTLRGSAISRVLRDKTCDVDVRGGYVCARPLDRERDDVSWNVGECAKCVYHIVRGVCERVGRDFQTGWCTNGWSDVRGPLVRGAVCVQRRSVCTPGAGSCNGVRCDNGGRIVERGAVGTMGREPCNGRPWAQGSHTDGSVLVTVTDERGAGQEEDEGPQQQFGGSWRTSQGYMSYLGYNERRSIYTERMT